MPKFCQMTWLPLSRYVRGERNSVNFLRWEEDASAFDFFVSENMTLYRWLQFIGIFNLFNNDVAKKPGT